MNTVMATSDHDLLSLEAAAEFLFVSKSTMYRLLDQGKLNGMKAGKQWRFRREELVEYMRRGPAAQALANLPIEVLDTELAFYAGELEKAGASPLDADDAPLEGEANKIAQLVRRMVWLMSLKDASDLHMEPVWANGDREVSLRLRMGGRNLTEIRRFPIALHEPLILEWLRLSGLSTELRDRPQDGTVGLNFGGVAVPLLIAVAPTIRGEKLAVRLVPTKVPTMDRLGFSDKPFLDWMLKWTGMIVFAGPTGSGKWTTAAACIQEMTRYDTNIIVVEDPIQYLFEHGVTQLKLKGLSLADGIRAAMHQDADIVAVGELKGDADVAQQAVAAAETGYLVITTMHAHDAVAPLFEFMDMGVKRSLLAANINGIVNQHLLQTLCPECKTLDNPDTGLLAEVRKSAEEGGYIIPDAAAYYRASGCDACHGSGYTGRRVAVHEFFSFTPSLKAAFLGGAEQSGFTKLVREQGQMSSFAWAIKRVVEAGDCSLEEAMRSIARWRD